MLHQERRVRPLTKCSADDVTGDATCGPCPKGYGRNPNDQFALCANVDGCANSPCFAGVLCTDAAPPKEGFTCGSCPIGYEGDGETCADVDECATNNGGCLDGTTCTNTPGGRTCGACPAGYKGSGETRVHARERVRRENGGCDPLTTCTDNGSGGSTCGACPAGGGYSGDGDSGCVDIDGCANSPCFAGVTCTDVPAPGTGYTCGKCPIGYEGDGVTCTPCKMSVSIAATTIVNGAVPAAATRAWLAPSRRWTRRVRRRSGTRSGTPRRARRHGGCARPLDDVLEHPEPVHPQEEPASRRGVHVPLRGARGGNPPSRRTPSSTSWCGRPLSRR